MVISGSRKGIAEAPDETKLTNPGYVAKDKTCFYCKEKGHPNSECPELTGNHSGKKCGYPGCTIQAGYTAKNCWEDPKN